MFGSDRKQNRFWTWVQWSSPTGRLGVRPSPCLLAETHRETVGLPPSLRDLSHQHQTVHVPWQDSALTFRSRSNSFLTGGAGNAKTLGFLDNVMVYSWGRLLASCFSSETCSQVVSRSITIQIQKINVSLLGVHMPMSRCLGRLLASHLPSSMSPYPDPRGGCLYLEKVR